MDGTPAAREVALSALWFEEHLRPANEVDVKCAELAQAPQMLRAHPRTKALYVFQTPKQMAQLTGALDDIELRGKWWAMHVEARKQLAKAYELDKPGTVELGRALALEGLLGVAQDDLRERLWQRKDGFVVRGATVLRAWPDRTPEVFDWEGNTNARLQALMKEHRLTRRTIASILGLASGKRSSGTVDMWLAGKRAMPDHRLQIIEDWVARLP